MTRFQIRANLKKAVTKESITGLQIRTRLKKKSSSVLFKAAYVGTSASGVALITLAGVSGAQAAVVNGNFSTNNFTGWQTIGNASVVNQKAEINAGGNTNKFDLEGFLGLASGALNTINTAPTFGSAIKQTISVAAGDTLKFDWLFDADDYLPYNDFSFYSISSAANLLADVALVGNYGQTSDQTTYTFANAGTYTIGFGVMNSLDNALSGTRLTVDNVEAVPEPLTILGTLAAGSIGAAMRRKYKQQDAN
ncbi:hypothetical protein DSM106972_076700 [Dulcicalothrix desertica PCC 7102]|uniref:PEP-CTERM protein-sorting domain-containing protein n=1 Tax=Dulcicalothrix desertica PCC 7102 TaxID=232991 RepID=A0A3S1IPH0_9CYAN|nr:PEP-CTERM sorting domain-containing protein [Dulcicalothrix desertica]RUT00222.1 hypothetical protein DSM106972_076700 [Dulcicalothrix desertica PCC 7102]TWH55690.1 putative secreted protein (TIGR04155 family) [Dulcicalothrix desertica PCC 7102]